MADLPYLGVLHTACDPIQGLSLKGRKDFRDVVVEMFLRKGINPHDKDRQK